MRQAWNRGGLRSYLIIIGLLATQTTPTWIAIGTPLLLLGTALHLWAKGCLHQNTEVTASGPYRFVRHPFYTANAMLDLGLALMSGWWVLIAVLPIWWLAVYIPTMRREEALLMELFPEQYAAFRKRVPQLVPWRRPLPWKEGGFSWQNPNLRKTEIPRTFSFLCYPFLFFIAYRFRVEGAGLFEAMTTLDVLMVAVCAALFLTGRALRTHFKDRRLVLPSWMTTEPFRLASVLAVVGIGIGVQSFEVEMEWATWLPGLMILAGAVAIRTLRPEVGLVYADALLATGLAMLFELNWLAMLLVPLYVAMVLDLRLADQIAEPQTLLARLQPTRVFSGSMFALLLIASVFLCMLEDGWI